MSSPNCLRLPSSSYLILLLLTFIHCTKAINYFAGADIVAYEINGDIQLRTVKITSIPRALPYGYYKYEGEDLPFCKPKNFEEYKCTLGQCLNGDVPQSSAYKVKALQTPFCKSLPEVEQAECPHHGNDYQQLQQLIRWGYRAQFTLDALPVAQVVGDKYEIGFKIGTYNTPNGTEQFLLNNHLNFTISYYYTDDTNTSVYIVGFTVDPYSVNTSMAGCDMTWDNDSSEDFIPLDITGRTGPCKDDFTWTYRLNWVLSDVKWENRWDNYFWVNEELHYVSLSYAIIVAIALSIFLAVVLIKIMRSSVAKYSSFEDVEESGWKTLHGDVFRPPHHFMLLSVLVGAGGQLLATAFVVLLLGAVGYLSPARSGSLNEAIVVAYPLMGWVGGYASARVYSRLGGVRKRRNAVLTAFGFQGLLFGIWFIAEIVLWSRSSSAGSVGTFFSVFALWICVNTPLVFLGSFFAHRRPVGTNPVGTNTIPRMIPPPPWYSHPYLLIPLLAVLPFGVSFNEIFDMMDAMWSHHVYYFFRVVLVVFVLLTVIIAEVSVVLCYFQLANENYHWWWRAFYIPGIVVTYIFLTAMFYVGINLQLKTAASVFLYLSYTSIILLVFFVFMSSISFYACWTFVHKIYSTLHVD